MNKAKIRPGGWRLGWDIDEFHKYLSVSMLMQPIRDDGIKSGAWVGSYTQIESGSARNGYRAALHAATSII